MSCLHDEGRTSSELMLMITLKTIASANALQVTLKIMHKTASQVLLAAELINGRMPLTDASVLGPC
jgi:hypothetical protein